MNIFEQLAEISRELNAQFLIIGGHAVNAYGYSRETKDLDILIRRALAQHWTGAMVARGYTIFNEAPNFVQLSPPSQALWPVDFMLVHDETFDKMFPVSKPIDYLPTKPRIPSVEHLLALKLHSLKHAHLGRFLRDYHDILGIIQCQKLDPRSEKIIDLFKKHANMDLYGKILRAVEGDRDALG